MQKEHHAISGLRELVEHSILTYYEFPSEMKMGYLRNGYQDLMCGHTWKHLLRWISLVPYGSCFEHRPWDGSGLSSFNGKKFWGKYLMTCMTQCKICE